MKTALAVVLPLILLSAIAEVPGRAPLSDASQFHDSIAVAKEIRVYEGLPHQMFERDLMKKELERLDIIKIATFPFYTPFIVPKDDSSLKAVLSAPASLELFAGEKMCGGFHPDYCISWNKDAKAFNALICFGCHEIILETEGRRFRYDLSRKAYTELKNILSSYGTKRPKKKNV